MAGRSWLINPPISSAAICCASAAEPPFPHHNIFPDALIASIMTWAPFWMSGAQALSMAVFT